MSRFCFSGGGKGGNRTARTIGLVLMAAGLLILLLSVPSWLWASLVGILLVSVGFLVWRFG